MKVRVHLRVPRPGTPPATFDFESATPGEALDAAERWLAALRAQP